MKGSRSKKTPDIAEGSIRLVPGATTTTFTVEQLTELRNAMLVACLSLVPNVRYEWDSLRIRPGDFDTAGSEDGTPMSKQERLNSNYVTIPSEKHPLPRIFFNTTKIDDAVRNLAGTPLDQAFENKFFPDLTPDAPLF